MLVTFLLILYVNYISAIDYYVDLLNDSPAIVGANITFTARLFTSDHKRPNGTFKYKWRDNVYPQNTNEFKGNAESNWVVAYPPDKYKHGNYEVEVTVFGAIIIIDWPICYKRSSFQLTNFLNGEMILKQNNTILNKEYVSNAVEVKHEIQFNYPDAEYLKYYASRINTYWFIDCIYVGNISGLQFFYNYSKPDISHSIEVFIDASFLPSNISSQNILKKISVTSKEIDIISSTATSSVIESDTSENKKFSYLTINNSTNNNVTDSNLLFDCTTKSIDRKILNHSYGIFSKKIKIKAPVENINIIGNNWLQHGDMLNLRILCNGSAPFDFCVKYSVGDYNITGNETCLYEIPSATCDFQVGRYFGNSTHYTVLLIIRNDINKVIHKVGVNVYEVNKHPQLSVIIVPISASLMAIVLIIFGIAYYIQSRNRYIIEVADFDFSNTNDMEYKTFHERLVEALHNAFNKTEDFSEQESYSGVPTNRKYGSMQ